MEARKRAANAHQEDSEADGDGGQAVGGGRGVLVDGGQVHHQAQREGHDDLGRGALGRVSGWMDGVLGWRV